MEAKIRRAAQDNPSVQFLCVDTSDTAGELYTFFAQNSPPIIPYYLVYKNDQKIFEGRWSDIEFPLVP